jgi:hypothetical protein
MNRTAFVIGAPGALAVQVAARLGAKGFGLEVLLASDQSGGLPRLQDDLGKEARIHLGRGDAVDFGLSGSEYLDAASRITDIVYLEPPPPPGLPGGVAGAAAREIVEFGLAASNLHRIVVLSHVDVCGEIDGTFGEHDLLVSGAGLGPAQEDRKKAERIYHRFFRELPLTILRSGWIVGAHPGLCPLAHLLLCLESPEDLGPVFSDIELNLVSLEDLSRIAAGLVESSSLLSGRTLHVVGEGLTVLRELHAEAVRRAADVIPAGFDRSAGARRAMKRDPHKRRWLVQEFFRHQPQRARITTAYTHAMLSQLGIAPPVFTDTWLEKVVSDASEEILGFR